MFGRKDKSAPPAPAAPPKDESENRDAQGTVIRKQLTLSSAYTYCHLAILLDGNEGLAPHVIRNYGIVGGSSDDTAICQPGDSVKCQLWRAKPESAWSIRGGVKIIFDLEKERAKLAGGSTAS
jgi:hypothetical protein